MAIDVRPDGSNQIFASGSTDGTVRLWDVRLKRAFETFRGHRSDVNSVRWFPTGPHGSPRATPSSAAPTTPRADCGDSPPGDLNKYICNKEFDAANVFDCDISKSGASIFACTLCLCCTSLWSSHHCAPVSEEEPDPDRTYFGKRSLWQTVA